MRVLSVSCSAGRKGRRLACIGGWQRPMPCRARTPPGPRAQLGDKGREMEGKGGWGDLQPVRGLRHRAGGNGLGGA